MAVKIVTLCGPRKYAAVFETVELALSKQGVIVLKPAFSDEVLTPIELQNLRQTHLKKIDLADEVVVINVAGYIGERTRQEIGYAQRQHKRIRYYAVTENEH